MNGRYLWQKARHEEDVLARNQWMKRACFHLMHEGDVIPKSEITEDVKGWGVKGKEFQLVTRRFMEHPWSLSEKLTEQDFNYLEKLSHIDQKDYVLWLTQLENKQVITRYPQKYIQGLLEDKKRPVTWQWDRLSAENVGIYLPLLIEQCSSSEYSLWATSSILQWDWSHYGWLAPYWDPSYLHAIFLQGHTVKDIDIVLAMLVHMHGHDEDALLDYQIMLHWFDPQGLCRSLNKDNIKMLAERYDYSMTKTVFSQEAILGDIWTSMSTKEVLKNMMTHVREEAPLYI